MNTSNMTRPILISGVALGVLTAIPPFNMINFCTCCSLFAAAGFLATYLLQKDSTSPVTTGDGALAGLGSGAIGGIVHGLFSIPVALLIRNLFPINRDFMESILDGLGSDSSGWTNILREYIAQGEGLVSLFSAAWFLATIIKTVVTIFLFSLFAMLGGIITAAVLQRRQPQAVYIPPPPRTTEETITPTPSPDIPEPPPDQL